MVSFLFFCYGCIISLSGLNIPLSQDQIKIRIVNESNIKLKELSLFSIDFENLNKNAKSKYRMLDFNQVEDNSVIQFKTKKGVFVQYVPYVIIKGKYSFHINVDSIGQNKFIIRLVKDQ